jgi:hypothetical protein
MPVYLIEGGWVTGLAAVFFTGLCSCKKHRYFSEYILPWVMSIFWEFEYAQGLSPTHVFDIIVVLLDDKVKGFSFKYQRII